MQELTTSANLVDYETLAGGNSITAVLPRSDLEAALQSDDSSQLWLEFERTDDEETRRLLIDLAPSDLEAMLAVAHGDEVSLALDGDALVDLFDEPDVEAHGLRGALAIAVTAGAIAAPASLAATPQTANPAATAQQARVAATSQQLSPAATAQVSGVAAKAQVSKVAAKSQVSRSLVLKRASLKRLRGHTLR